MSMQGWEGGSSRALRPDPALPDTTLCRVVGEGRLSPHHP